ncbi:MAG: hypothetical protein ACI4TX_02300 [Christensenellales bacterium]
METFIAKIYAENQNTLVLEVCEEKPINNILKLSTNQSPYVKIYGAENIAISTEAKILFIEILHKAKTDYEKRTSLSIIPYLNNDLLLTWDGANKQKISLNDINKLNIGLGLGIYDENLLNLIPVKDNSYLKNYKFESNHIDKVCAYLTKLYSEKKSTNTKSKIKESEKSM